MTDAAFHEAISANPAEDTVRLAYADYLDETAGTVGDGRAELAEFIRVQVELAKLDCPGCRPDFPCSRGGQCRKRRLEDRSSAHGRAWSGGIMDALGVTGGAYPVMESGGWWRGSQAGYGWRFTRGFVSHVRVPTLAEVCGDRACERCDSAAGPIRTPACPACPACSGTGRVRACPGCGGTGRERYDSGDPFGGYDYRCCRSCRGSGTLPPLAPKLREACPGLSLVWCGDREPHSSNNVGLPIPAVFWCSGPGMLPDTYRPHDLFAPIFDLLTDYEPGQPSHLRFYKSAALASAALAGAVGGWVMRHEQSLQ